MKRFMVLKAAALVFFALVPTVLCTPADAYVYLSVTGAKVNIRAEANTRGKVYIQASKGDLFIAEDEPATNSNDGSKWYKIVMSVGNGYVPLAADERFGVTTAYISANFANATKLHENEEKEIAKVLTSVTSQGVAAEGAKTVTENQQEGDVLPEPVNIEEVVVPTIHESNTR